MLIFSGSCVSVVNHSLSIHSLRLNSFLMRSLPKHEPSSVSLVSQYFLSCIIYKQCNYDYVLCLWLWVDFITRIVKNLTALKPKIKTLALPIISLMRYIVIFTPLQFMNAQFDHAACTRISICIIWTIHINIYRFTVSESASLQTHCRHTRVSNM